MRVKLGSKGFIWLVPFLLCLILAGCGGRAQQEVDDSSHDVENTVSLEDILPEDLIQAEQKDNSLDDYQAKQNMLVRPKELEDGFTYGGWNLVLSDSRAYMLQKHLHLTDYQKSWDELIIAFEDGRVESKRLSLPFTPDNNNQIVRMGRVYGNDHLVCVNAEESEQGTEWRVFELNEELVPQWDFVADFLDVGKEWFPESILCDREGKVHMDFRSGQQNGGELIHYVVNVDGEVLDSFSMSEQEDVTFSQDWSFTLNGELLLKRTLQEKSSFRDEIYAGTSDKELGQIIAIKQYGGEERKSMQYVLQGKDTSLYGDEAVLCADETGIYRCDMNWKHQAYLYEWKNHGIAPRNIGALWEGAGGWIHVFYQEDDGNHYMVLAPTTEGADMKEIVLAIPSYREIYYRPLVDAFQKKYPCYRIQIKTDYDETRLLAELGTGNGPTLVDTRLVGFEAQKRLWEPLDDILEAGGLNGKLHENVMELCRIDGATYGIALDFTVFTVVSQKGTSENWNYERFLKTLEEGDYKAAFPVNYGMFPQGAFLEEMLMHGLEDNYLIHADDPGNCMDLAKWERALDLAERYCSEEDPAYDWEKAIQNGEVLCESVALPKMTMIAALKKRWGEDMAFVGFPTAENGRHLIAGVIPLSVRAGAGEEEKKVAYAFLLEALSYEGQMLEIEKNYNFGISVRKDVFEEQMGHNMEDYIKLARMEGVAETKLDSIRKDLSEDAELFRKIVKEAVPMRRLPAEVEAVLSEEMTNYFHGEIPRELFLEHLQSRLKLYLYETVSKGTVLFGMFG